MIDLGRYAVPVLAAWGAGLVLLAVIVAQTLIRSAAARRALAEEEARQRARVDA